VADCNLIAFRRVFQKLCRERQPASPVRIFASLVGIDPVVLPDLLSKDAPLLTSVAQAAPFCLTATPSTMQKPSMIENT
jgi:hypothetical protein